MLKHLSKTRILTTAGLLTFLAPLFSGCAADSQQNANDATPSDQDELSVAPSNDPGTDVAPPDDVDALTTDDSVLEAPVAQGEKLTTSVELNLRSGPSASDAIVTKLPEGAEVTVESPEPSKGFYRVKFGDHTGWASGLFLVNSSSSSEGIAPQAEMSTEAAKTNPAVSRALEWVHVKMPYCGGVNGGHDLICGGTCRRSGAANNPAWNKYRSDCSGLVSFAWGVAAPGQITDGFAPFSGRYSHGITAKALQPGDALNSVPSHHIMLFAGWANQAKGEAKVIQEYDCGQVAREMVLTFKPHGAYLHTSWDNRNFLPIRKR